MFSVLNTEYAIQCIEKLKEEQKEEKKKGGWCNNST